MLGLQCIIVAHQSWNNWQFVAQELKLGSARLERFRSLRLRSCGGEFLLGVSDFFCQLQDMSFGKVLGCLSLAHIVDEHLDFRGVGISGHQFGAEIIRSEDFVAGTGAECEKYKQHYDEAKNSRPVHDSKMLE